MSSEKPKQMWPRDIIKHGILPFVEPSCDIISNNGKRCSETWEFKSKSGKTADCSHYCKQHIDKWFNDIFNSNYIIKMNEKTYKMKIHKVEIIGYFNCEKIPFFKFLESVQTCLTIDYTDEIGVSFVLNDRMKYIGEQKMDVELFNHFDIKEINIMGSAKINNPTNFEVYRDDHLSKGWSFNDSKFIKSLWKQNIDLICKQFFIKNEDVLIDTLNNLAKFQYLNDNNEIEMEYFNEILIDAISDINIPNIYYEDCIEYFTNNIDRSKLKFTIV